MGNRNKSKDIVGKVSVYIPIYDIQTELYIGENSIPSNMPIDTEYKDGSVQLISRGDIRKIVIWLRKINWTSEDIGLLTHELYHVVEKVLAIIGIQETVDEEIRAYLLEFLVREYSTKINNRWRFN